VVIKFWQYAVLTIFETQWPSKKLVRYEYGGENQYGDLISSGGDDFLVKRLKESVQTGFSSTLDEPVTVTKVSVP
jgi:hypothetical protein